MGITREIAIEFARAANYKYLSALGLVYLRIVEKGPEVYHILEPFLNDNRKLRMRDSKGQFSIVYVDELVDRLLTEEIVLDIALPRIQKRQNL